MRDHYSNVRSFAFCYNWRFLQEDVTVIYLLLIHLNNCNLFVVRNTIQHLHIVIRMINNVGMNHRKQPSADYKPIIESSTVKKQRSSPCATRAPTPARPRS